VAHLRDDRADRRLERPETSAEGDLLFVADRLPAEEEHRMLIEGLRDVGEGRLVDAPDVDAEDLDAEHRMERIRPDRHAGLPPKAVTATPMIERDSRVRNGRLRVA